MFCIRSPQLKANELQDIVFLCTSLPTPKTFESVSRFPKVYFMLVNSYYDGVFSFFFFPHRIFLYLGQLSASRGFDQSRRDEGKASSGDEVLQK